MKKEEIMKFVSEFFDIITEEAKSDQPKKKEVRWKTIGMYEVYPDKYYLVRDTDRLDFPPIVAYWNDDIKAFIEVRGAHAYGLIVDEFMEIPE